jgi:hypothetical protein
MGYLRHRTTTPPLKRAPQEVGDPVDLTHMRMAPGPIAPVALALLLALAPTAQGYTVKATSTGAPLHWPAGAIAMTPAFDPHPGEVDVGPAEEALTNATSTWQAELDGAGVSFTAITAEAAPLIHGSDGVNQVRWAFALTDPDVEPGVLALTFINYRTADGEIADADVVVNAASFRWTTAATCVSEYDLESALTHELGHLLGLAHSAGHPEATMFATGTSCETTKRILAADDKAGLASIYRGATTAPGGCAAAPGGGLAALALVLTATLAIGRRRRASLAVAATLLAAAPANAAQLRLLDLPELTRDAAVIVRGHVTAVAPAIDGELATEATLAIDECLAGPCRAPQLVIRRRGGERGGRGLWVDGEAELAPGADVVLFLRRDAAGRLRVLGGVQGALRVITVAGRTFAFRDLRTQHVLVPGDDGRATFRPGPLELFPLDAVRRGPR